MKPTDTPDANRRTLLMALAAVPIIIAVPSVIGLSGCSNKRTSTTARSSSAQPTRTCPDDDAEPTASETEGPYFTPNSPERSSLLEAGLAGTTLVVTGKVLSRSCAPVPGALLDFWQADDGGQYDNSGYRLRGHQFTDQDGNFKLTTIVPGLYPGRTRHIHVKVQAPNQPILTTQLFFPGEPGNARDGIFHESLLLDYRDQGDSKEGEFDFVLDLA